MLLQLERDMQGQQDRPATLNIVNSLPSFNKCYSCKLHLKGIYCRGCDSLPGVLVDRDQNEQLCTSKNWGYKQMLMSHCCHFYYPKSWVLREIRNFVRSDKPRWLFLCGHCFRQYDGFKIIEGANKEKALYLAQIYQIFLEETKGYDGANLYVVADYCYSGSQLDEILQQPSPGPRRRVHFYCASRWTTGDHPKIGGTLNANCIDYYQHGLTEEERAYIGNQFWEARPPFIDNETENGQWRSKKPMNLPL